MKSRFRAHQPSDIAFCAVVKAELLYGAYRSARREDNLRLLVTLFWQFESLPFDDTAAETYGRIRADLAMRGTPIGPNDLMIASIALAHHLILVTHNTREFGRVAGLQLEDWQCPQTLSRIQRLRLAVARQHSGALEDSSGKVSLSRD